MKDRTLNTGSAAPTRFTLAVCLSITILTACVYFQIGSHQFINFDDPIFVENRYVKQGVSTESLYWCFFQSADKRVWIPITWLSHILDQQLFGQAPGMHHLMNLSFHIASSCLLFLIFNIATKDRWPSFFIALLFAVHPVNTEPVAWVASRKDVLYAFFWMLALLSYVIYASREKIIFYISALFFFFLGLLSKPVILTLPFVFLLFDFWPLRRYRPFPLWHRSTNGNNLAVKHCNATGSFPKEKKLLFLLLEKIPFFILSFVSLYISMITKEAVVSTSLKPMTLRIENAIVSYMRYIGKALFPDDLSFFYPYPDSIPAWQTIGSAVALAGMLILSIYYLKKSPYLATGWLWFMGTLVPVSGLVQAGVQPAIANRYAYIPFIGLYIILVFGFADIKWKYPVLKKYAVFFSTMGVILLIPISFFQVAHWKNNVTLYNHTLSVVGNIGLINNNLGVAYMDIKDFKKAQENFVIAIQLEPNSYNALNNMASIFLHQQKYSDAIEYCDHALRLKPNFIAGLNNKAYAMMHQERYKEALQILSTALSHEPDNPKTHNYIGAVYRLTNAADKAIYHIRLATQLNPDYPEAHYNLGMALWSQGVPKQALNAFKRALDLRPDKEKYKRMHARAIQKVSEDSEAIASIVQSLKSNPGDADGHYQLGTLYRNQRSFNLAIKSYEKALSISPHLHQVKFDLAMVYAATGGYVNSLQLLKAIAAENPENEIAPYHIACILARQNKLAASAKWLQTAIDRGYSNKKQLQSDPNLNNLRTSPYYEPLLNRF